MRTRTRVSQYVRNSNLATRSVMVEYLVIAGGGGAAA